MVELLIYQGVTYGLNISQGMRVDAFAKIAKRLKGNEQEILHQARLSLHVKYICII